MLFDLPCPVVHRLQAAGLRHVEDNDHCIAVFVVERQKRAELFLASGIPEVHSQRLPVAIIQIVALEAGPESIRSLAGKCRAMKNLKDTGFADIFVGTGILVSPRRMTLGFFFIISI